jgi:hypothetical protein
LERNKNKFFIVFVVLPPLMTMADVPEQYGANNCLMETFSGSTESPGRALSGDVLQIATAHPHGLQNSRQTKCIFFHC